MIRWRGEGAGPFFRAWAMNDGEEDEAL